MRDWKNNRHPSSLFGCKCAFLCWSISGLNNTWVGKWEQKIAKLYPELLLDVPAPWTIREPSVSPGLNTCQPLKQKKKIKKKLKDRQVSSTTACRKLQLSLSLSTIFLSLHFLFISLPLRVTLLSVEKASGCDMLSTCQLRNNAFFKKPRKPKNAARWCTYGLYL